MTRALTRFPAADFQERLAQLMAQPEPTMAELVNIHVCPECEAEVVDAAGELCDTCTDDASTELARAEGLVS